MTEGCPYFRRCKETLDASDEFKQEPLFNTFCGSRETYEHCIEYQINSELDEQISHDLRKNPQYQTE